jgi:hypothetical protein
MSKLDPKSKHAAINQPKYRGFIKQRDAVLNKLYFDLQGKLSIALANGMYSIQQVYKMYYNNVEKHGFDHNIFLVQKSKLEQFIKNSSHFEETVLNLITVYRRRFWALAKASEMEALGRVLPKKPKLQITKQDLWEVSHKKTKRGASLESVVHIGVQRQFHKFIEAFQSAFLQQATLDKALDLFAKQVPTLKGRPKQIKAPDTYKESKRLREASRQDNQDTIDQMKNATDESFTNEDVGDDEPDFSFQAGVIDPEVMSDLQDAYAEEYVPTYSFRDPNMKWDIPTNADEDNVVYGWQVEQSMSEDFVMNVRDGQNAAANDAGISDMMWLSVLSEKTCDSCGWRDGLTSTEIESKMDEMADTENDAIVPPAHPNCYCTMTPYDSSIDDYGKDTPEIGSIDEWINQMAENQ